MKCRFALLVLAITLSACSQSSTRMHVYWGTTIERPPAGTVYDWSADSAHLDTAQDEKLRNAIRDDVEFEMAAMGFVKRSDTQPPAMLVAVHWGRGLQPSPSGPEQRATLAIQVHDVASGRMIYCGSADALVDPTLTPETRRSRIDRAIHELLKPLDPIPAGSRCRG